MFRARNHGFDREHAFGLALPQKIAFDFRLAHKRTRLPAHVDLSVPTIAFGNVIVSSAPAAISPSLGSINTSPASGFVFDLVSFGAAWRLAAAMKTGSRMKIARLIPIRGWASDLHLHYRFCRCDAGSSRVCGVLPASRRPSASALTIRWPLENPRARLRARPDCTMPVYHSDAIPST